MIRHTQLQSTEFPRQQHFPVQLQVVPRKRSQFCPGKISFMGPLPPQKTFLKTHCFNTRDSLKAVWLLLTFRHYFQSHWHMGREQRKLHPFDYYVHLTTRYSEKVEG